MGYFEKKAAFVLLLSSLQVVYVSCDAGDNIARPYENLEPSSDDNLERLITDMYLNDMIKNINQEAYGKRRAPGFVGKREDETLEEVKKNRFFVGKKDEVPDYYVSAADDDQGREKRRRMFVGKRHRFIGKRYNMEDLARTYQELALLLNEEMKPKRRLFVGKREDNEDIIDKRRLFVGKREDDADIDKRRLFVGKREDDEDIDKRRLFVGKRDSDKRRLFIGKKSENAKRRLFVGKKDTEMQRMFDEINAEKRRLFVGKKNEDSETHEVNRKSHFFVGKKDRNDIPSFGDKRRLFIGKRRWFVGKREDGELPDLKDKRGHRFVGKRDTAKYTDSAEPTFDEHIITESLNKQNKIKPLYIGKRDVDMIEDGPTHKRGHFFVGKKNANTVEELAKLKRAHYFVGKKSTNQFDNTPHSKLFLGDSIGADVKRRHFFIGKRSVPAANIASNTHDNFSIDSQPQQNMNHYQKITTNSVSDHQVKQDRTPQEQ